MAAREPTTTVDPDFSSKDAAPMACKDARTRLGAAEVFWVSTVRPDGRPHVTPLIAVWLDDALFFATGESERKAKNLAWNSHCILTTACNGLAEGLDLVVEGDARRVTDDTFHHRDVHEGAAALVYELTPRKAFGFFRKGAEYSQNRWTF